MIGRPSSSINHRESSSNSNCSRVILCCTGGEGSLHRGRGVTGAGNCGASCAGDGGVSGADNGCMSCAGDGGWSGGVGDAIRSRSEIQETEVSGGVPSSDGNGDVEGSDLTYSSVGAGVAGASRSCDECQETDSCDGCKESDSSGGGGRANSRNSARMWLVSRPTTRSLRRLYSRIIVACTKNVSFALQSPHLRSLTQSAPSASQNSQWCRATLECQLMG